MIIEYLYFYCTAIADYIEVLRVMIWSVFEVEEHQHFWLLEAIQAGIVGVEEISLTGNGGVPIPENTDPSMIKGAKFKIVCHRPGH